MDEMSDVFMGIEWEYVVAQHISEDAQRADSSCKWACPPPSKNPWLKEQDGELKDSWAEMVAIKKSCDILATTGIPVACRCLDTPPGNYPISEGATNDDIHRPSDPELPTLRLWNQPAARPSPGPNKRELQNWVVVPETHISRDVKDDATKAPPGSRHWIGLELNSPIITSADEVTNGLPTLNRALEALRNNIEVAINSSCGLHLHASNRGSLDLETAQRVACLVLLLEDALLIPLCHSSRQNNPFAAPIATHSVAALSPYPATHSLTGDGSQQLKALEEYIKGLGDGYKIDKKTLDAMRRIYSQTNLLDLRMLLKKFDLGLVRTTKRCALVVSKHNTIEFRYPAATMNVQYIAGWAKLVRHIFAAALKPTLQFSDLLCRVYEVVTRDEQVDWPAVMRAIGFNEVQPEVWKGY